MKDPGSSQGCTARWQETADMLGQERFRVDIGRNFFPTRTSQRQSRLHRNVGQALLLDVFQVLTVICGGNSLVSVTLLNI